MSYLNNYIDFKRGNIPLILSVPHGGILECDSIPQRTNGVLGIDKGTIELSVDLADYIQLKFEEEQLDIKFPYSINSKIRRSKVDINRRKSEAYNQSSNFAREIYTFYHSKIEEWVSSNLKSFGHSLLIDIHGFEKDARPSGFRDVEIILGTNNLGSIFSESIPKRNWEKNLRGKIIEAFLQLGVPIAPGHPRRREYVLTGGYITRKYGASNFPKSQTIQIEFSDNIRIYDSKLRTIVLKTLAEVFYNYYLSKLDI